MKKILFLAVALVMSVCSMWADIAPGTYTIKAYGTDQYIIPSSNWFNPGDGKVTGADKVAYSTTATLDNGGHWTIANATADGGFTISPAAAKFVHSNGDHGYLNPWNNTSNVGTWKTTAGDDRWDFIPVDGKENVYYIESKAKSGNYLCYNPSSDYLQYLPTASITGEMVYQWELEKISLINTAKKYYFKNNYADKYVVLNASGNATISATNKTAFELAESGSGFTIKGGTNYLGASGWNTQPQSSAFVWTVAKVAEGYTFNQQTASYTGYLGLNANTSAEGSKLYCNKGASDPIVFTLEEVPMSSYVLTITGQDGVKVTYDGHQYASGETINCYGLDASEIEPQAVENYITQVTVGDGTVTVAYYYAKHITDLEQLSNDKAYVLICARGQLTTNGEGLSTTGTPSYAADASKFAIYNDGENLYLWSIALEGFVNTDKGVATTPHQVLALTKQSDNTFLGILNGKGLNMQNNGASIIIDTYTTPDPGNKYNIYEVADFAGAADIEAILNAKDWDAFESKLQQLQQYIFGEGLGQYADVDLSEEFYGSTTASEMIEYYGNDFNAKDEEYYDDDMEQMEYILTHIQINLPQAGKFYRIKGLTSDKYITGNGTSGQVVLSETADINTVLYYDESNHLIGYVNGRGFNATHSVAGIGSFETHTFSEAPFKQGCYLIKSNYSGSQVLCDWTDGKLNRWGTENDTRSSWCLEEVESLPVTFKAAGEGYATIYSPVALEIPTDIIAYYGTEESEGTVKVSPIKDGIIPANTAVVLFKEGVDADTTVEFDITTGGAATSCFTGTIAAKTSTEEDGNYVFSIANENAGFYKFGGATLAGFKAYYKPEVASVQGFVLDFGGQTVGIEGLQTAAPVKGAFDLQGRRVNAATRGLFIQNGVKVIK